MSHSLMPVLDHLFVELCKVFTAFEHSEVRWDHQAVGNASRIRGYEWTGIRNYCCDSCRFFKRWAVFTVLRRIKPNSKQRVRGAHGAG